MDQWRKRPERGRPNAIVSVTGEAADSPIDGWDPGGAASERMRAELAEIYRWQWGEA